MFCVICCGFGSEFRVSGFGFRVSDVALNTGGGSKARVIGGVSDLDEFREIATLDVERRGRLAEEEIVEPDACIVMRVLCVRVCVCVFV